MYSSGRARFASNDQLMLQIISNLLLFHRNEFSVSSSIHLGRQKQVLVGLVLVYCEKVVEISLQFLPPKEIQLLLCLKTGNFVVANSYSTDIHKEETLYSIFSRIFGPHIFDTLKIQTFCDFFLTFSAPLAKVHICEIALSRSIAKY